MVMTVLTLFGVDVTSILAAAGVVGIAIAFGAQTLVKDILSGLFIWAELPEKIDAVSMLAAAVEKKVAYVPGTYFCVDGGHLNTIRLNFSNSTPEQIEAGMDTLREIIEKQ